MESNYTCEICQETVVVNKNEQCLYGDISYEQTGVNDIHKEVRNCQVCQYRLEQEGNCVPVGELQYVKIYAQIYEYYDCELCKDMCRRAYHTNHQFPEDWEYRDSQSHIRYCGCIEGREIENHKYIYDGETSVTCEGCHDTITVEKHHHGHGYDDIDEKTGEKQNRNRDLMELIKSPAYNELVSFSQLKHPNSPDLEYCSRYDFKCKVCNGNYYIYYDHERGEDGRCTRGYCDHVQLPEDWVNPVKKAA